MENTAFKSAVIRLCFIGDIFAFTKLLCKRKLQRFLRTFNNSDARVSSKIINFREKIERTIFLSLFVWYAFYMHVNTCRTCAHNFYMVLKNGYPFTKFQSISGLTYVKINKNYWLNLVLWIFTDLFRHSWIFLLFHYHNSSKSIQKLTSWCKKTILCKQKQKQKTARTTKQNVETRERRNAFHIFLLLGRLVTKHECATLCATYFMSN